VSLLLNQLETSKTMSLRERLVRENNSAAVMAARGGEESSLGTQHTFQEMKSRLHRAIINRMDLTKLSQLDAEQLRAEVSRLAEGLLAVENMPLSTNDRERLVEEVRHELFGLGPLEPLLADPTISDILVNSPHNIYIERRGKLERTDVAFKDDEHLMRVIERIVSSVGRRIDESSPMVDARLSDGSRVNAIIPPLSLDGPVLSIRRFGAEPLRMSKLIEIGALTKEIAEMCEMCVSARLNILISGGTGAGKTTLLNALSAYIPEEQRIVTIEDSAELQLQQPHVVRLETRPPNIEGRGEVTQRDLVKNALRMRPDRIVIGEVRGGEAIDMLQAMNTGHDGSLTTVHANTPRDALARLETMIQMTGMKLSERAMRQQIASALNLVLQAARLSDGTRRIVSISEITGMEGDTITMQEIFMFERKGIDKDGHVVGRFRPTGVRPRFAERLKVYGMQLPRVFFEESQ
jgi:pilus assembly protein CpaF